MSGSLQIIREPTDITKEAAMKSYQDSQRKIAIAAVNVPAIEKFFALLAIAAMLAMLLIAANSKPVLSQGVQLIKVDVAVIAKGLRISKILGASVINDKNENIGKLDDMIVDNKRALFAVLQVGGFLGLGGHLVAVPYESLVIEDNGRKITLPGASKDELKKLGEFKYPT
jgi:sporulation protein YlmC with PRC-barrel domain